MTSFEVPEDISPSNFVDKDGTYHVMIQTVEDPATKENGDVLNGIGFGFTVLAGTDSSQVRRTAKITVFNPDMSSKDGGLFSRKRFARLARAFGLHDKASGKPIDQCRGGAVEIDWNEARGRQAIIRLVHGKDKEGKPTRFMDIDGLQIYHVNDQDGDVKDIPRNPKALALLGQPAAAEKPVEKAASAPKPAPVAAPAKSDWESALFGG